MYIPLNCKIEPFETFLIKILSSIQNANKDLHIAGDFNRNLLDHESNKKALDLLNIIYRNGMIPTINKPARVTKTMASVIDHILTNSFIDRNFKTAIFKSDVSKKICTKLIGKILRHLLFQKRIYTGWPTKMSLFFFEDNFYKNKATFKIFSPQILEVYRILLVKTTLESIMFYYTFSVINTMFVLCAALLYDSTATRTLKLSTTLLSISSGIRLISLLMMSSLV